VEQLVPPRAYQGTLVSDLKNPIANLSNAQFDGKVQRKELDALKRSTRCTRPSAKRIHASAPASSRSSLPIRMQAEAPEAFNVGAEDPDTLKLYGVGEPVTDLFARQCVMARRLVERGVRIVQVYHTQTSKRASCQLWDQHGGLKSELPNNCRRPISPWPR
jgi:hypothetical protein